MHKYIITSNSPRKGSISEAASLLTNHYLPSKKSINKWKKENELYELTYKDNNGKIKKSAPINYLQISKHLRELGHFSTQAFNLPISECFWLDNSINIKINWHKFDETGPEGLAVMDVTPQAHYGNNYPIKPKLVREGHSYSTLQSQLLIRIQELRTKLIEESDQALEDSWFFDLRTLINDTVSIVEITLNQIYIKAEYDPLSNWVFDKTKLGERHGRRFEDKLGWIYKICGNHLNAEKYLPSCNNLRELRNHMMHFDPPSLLVTIEEANTWLNQIIDVGYLLIKIRQAIGVEISGHLINFILQKEAIFNPEAHFKERLPIGIGNSDYASSTWPK